ncbi:MAG: hypothetical protein ACHP7N_11340 [Caulobacterales bacterium]
MDDERKLTAREAEQLAKLVHPRIKVLKAAAKEWAQRAKADFEAEIAAQYAFDDDEVWEAAAKSAGEAVKSAQAVISARCRELGIPDEFAPNLTIGWRHNGYRNSTTEAKAEMRRVAHSRIDAMLAAKLVEIDKEGLRLRTDLIMHQSLSPAVTVFLETWQPIDDMAQAIAQSDRGRPLAPRLITSVTDAADG